MTVPAPQSPAQGSPLARQAAAVPPTAATGRDNAAGPGVTATSPPSVAPGTRHAAGEPATPPPAPAATNVLPAPAGGNADPTSAEPGKTTGAGRTPYARGKGFEYRVRVDLRDNGYEVIRSAGSKTKVDLVAVKPGQLLFIQCKRNSVLPPLEWNRLYALAYMVGAVPIVASQNGARGGITYGRIVGVKDPERRTRKQPVERFALDEVVAP